MLQCDVTVFINDDRALPHVIENAVLHRNVRVLHAERLVDVLGVLLMHADQGAQVLVNLTDLCRYVPGDGWLMALVRGLSPASLSILFLSHPAVPLLIPVRPLTSVAQLP